MAVGLVALDLVTGAGHSLKEKRRLVAGLKERLHRRFNISVAETDYQDLWQRAELTIVCVASDGRSVQAQLDQAVAFVRRQPELELLNCERMELA